MDGTPAKNAIIRLYLNSVDFYTKTCDENGHYSFVNLVDCRVTLIATADSTYSMTAMISDIIYAGTEMELDAITLQPPATLTGRVETYSAERKNVNVSMFRSPFFTYSDSNGQYSISYLKEIVVLITIKIISNHLLIQQSASYPVKPKSYLLLYCTPTAQPHTTLRSHQ